VLKEYRGFKEFKVAMVDKVLLDIQGLLVYRDILGIRDQLVRVHKDQQDPDQDLLVPQDQQVQLDQQDQLELVQLVQQDLQVQQDRQDLQDRQDRRVQQDQLEVIKE
jgi:hypothetical protein